MFHIKLFGIFAIFLLILPEINSHRGSYYDHFLSPSTSYNTQEYTRRYWQEPQYITGYHGYPIQNNPMNLHAASEVESRYFDEPSFDAYPGQGYPNKQVDDYHDGIRARQIHQHDSEEEDFDSFENDRSLPQVNYDYKHTNHHHHYHHHTPPYHTHTKNSNQHHQTLYPNRIQTSYQTYQNREPLQKDSVPLTTTTNIREQSIPVFKVQRNPEGKLNVVFNDSIDVVRNGDENPIQTNPNRRSTQKVMTTTTASTMRPTSPSRRGDIIFPDDLDRNRPLHPPPPPKCSEGEAEDFCTKVENYPAAHVQAIIQSELDKYEEIFGGDMIPDSQKVNVTQRIDVPGEESLCASTEELIYPQAGLTKDNSWSFIVNQQNYTQGIRIEKCLTAGKACHMSELFPNGYKTECRQHYIYRQLLSVNAEGKVAKDLFRLPSCCKCIIKTNNRFRRDVS